MGACGRLTNRRSEQESAMATVLTPTARPAALRKGAAGPATHRDRLKRAIHRRAGRIEGILLVLAMLLPQLIITLLGR
jgi:hypothetical protein